MTAQYPLRGALGSITVEFAPLASSSDLTLVPYLADGTDTDSDAIELSEQLVARFGPSRDGIAAARLLADLAIEEGRSRDAAWWARAATRRSGCRGGA